MAKEIALALEKGCKSFTIGKQSLDVLVDANLELAKGEVVGLFAPSGSGKTTLLQIIGLLDKPDSGKVTIQGRNVAALSESVRDRIRGSRFGFVLQSHYLLPELTALKNVALPARVVGKSAGEAEAQARELLEAVGLSQRLEHFPSELSGGERQRAAIARALCNAPEVVLADEPTGNLDPQNSNVVFDLLVAQLKQKNHAALIVTHNPMLARRLDRCVTINKGQIEPIKP